MKGFSDIRVFGGVEEDHEGYVYYRYHGMGVAGIGGAYGGSCCSGDRGQSQE
ncbi:hypothetical protein KDH_71490 [Dictyobacter sp. S3.2.2.5]|uniref:Uncharacterized protein n=1 Tax=Dictyobacter halimunensis TaxID=3026934 RepID=A0ABQ6G371_9CHLR|nr:hypothetical protein KDH_71490 [Dictyobacter sp. S3.2.2.5]